MTKQSRRDFLKTGALSSIMLGSGMFAASACTPVRDEGKAKNIIFLVSDGMSSGTLTMADVMLRRRDNRPSNWIKLYEEGKACRGLMDMASANQIVTDSAAAAASWGCGYRVNNGSLNIGVNGEQHKPITSIFTDAGKSTGLVTTAEITHATPAGFAANVESRSMGEEIAKQYLERKIDVLLGGGNRHFDAELRTDGIDLYADYEKEDYNIIRSKADFQKDRGSQSRLLGVFSDGHVPYTLDYLNTPEHLENIPTLVEMTEIALENLSRNSNGFILQVEGGRVDHAAHSNDVGGLLYDQIAFDQAIGTVLKFTENRDDTLVIITSDHGNANPGFNASADGNFDRIQNFKHTNDWIQKGIIDQSSISQIRERIEAATGLGVTKQEAEVLQQAMHGTYSAVYNRMNSRQSVLGQIIANHTNVNWIGGSHTADYVELGSYGPGSEALEGFVINTRLFDVMTRSAGVMEFA